MCSAEEGAHRYYRHSEAGFENSIALVGQVHYVPGMRLSDCFPQKIRSFTLKFRSYLLVYLTGMYLCLTL